MSLFNMSLVIFITFIYILCQVNSINAYDPSICRKWVRNRYIRDCCSGYIKSESSDSLKCDPICLLGCRNGFCSAPGVCECLPGYLPDPVDMHACLPDCQGLCFHGVCTAPNTCTCNFGYKSAPPNAAFPGAVCIPQCTEPCNNGSCVAPESCSCNHGYRMSASNTCEPYCSTGCNNGRCVGPETCGCDDGWLLVGNRCEPICSPSCFNGECIAPNHCRCHDGYYALSDFYTCLPASTTTTVSTTVSTTDSTPVPTELSTILSIASDMTGITNADFDRSYTTTPSIGDASSTEKPLSDFPITWVYACVGAVVLVILILISAVMCWNRLRAKGGNYAVKAPQDKDPVDFQVTFSSIAQKE